MKVKVPGAQAAAKGATGRVMVDGILVELKWPLRGFELGSAKAKMSGSEKALVAPYGPYTTRLLGSRIMSAQSTRVRASEQEPTLYRVYLVTNLRNGKRYVGITKRTVERRWRAHVNTALRGSPCWLHRAVRKHGEAAFAVEELAVVWGRESANEIEKVLVVFFRTYGFDGEGYNQTCGGDGNSTEPTAETRRKMSASAKARSHSDVMAKKAKGNTSRRGKTTPIESARKISRSKAREFLTYGSETLTLWEWSQRTGIKAHAIRTRLKHGWPPDKVLTKPIRRPSVLTLDGVTLTLTEWAARTGIFRGVIVKRLAKGWSVKQILTPFRRPKH